MIAEITIPGRAYTKKNSQKICRNPATGVYFITQSDRYQRYEEECLWRLKSYRGPKFTSNVRVTCVYWMPSYQSWPDLMGLYQATADILQKAGIIKNDRDIVSMDGSRIAGIDSGNPRVEIEIEGGVIE